MKTLNELRDDIEKIDAQIIKKLAQREKKVQQIGLLKKASGSKIKDATREKKLMRLYEKLSEQYGLSEVWVKRIFRLVILHSRRVQK
jgi:chorismate mutase